MALTLTIARDAFLAACVAAKACGSTRVRLRANTQSNALELAWTRSDAGRYSGFSSVSGATAIGNSPTDSVARIDPLIAGLTQVTAGGNVTVATTESPAKWVLTWGSHSVSFTDERP